MFDKLKLFEDFAELEVNYPKNEKIDLMKYFNKKPNFLDFDFERIVVESKDVLGHIWLTKLQINEI